MPDKNFFNLLKAKMAALRPREDQRSAGWAALKNQLDIAVPQQPQRRPLIVLPVLLFAALLSTNALWWHSSHGTQVALDHVEAKLAAMESTIQSATAPQTIIKRDTVWQIKCLAAPVGRREAPNQNIGTSTISTVDNSKKTISTTGEAIPGTSRNQLDVVQNNNTTNKEPRAIPKTEKQETATNTGVSNTVLLPLELPGLQPLELPGLQPLEIPERRLEIANVLTVATALESEPPIKIFTKKIAHTLRPKFYKIGASAGWLNAASKQLMHEGGIAYNLQAEIGLSPHLRLMADYSIGKMHYKAHSPDAILGTPDFPMLPTTGHHYLEMDVTGQRIQQFGLGLRYSFAQLGKSRPFFGLSWGGQTLKPFSIEYEIQHEPSGAIEKAVFNVTTKTQLKNLMGINAGFEISLSNRINFIMQGFYQRQWKKSNSAAPDLTGVRAGINLSL